MRTIQVDVGILGAGTAGLNARRAAVAAGATAVLVDPGPLGTTCARVGCMPSKLLIAAADAAHEARHADVFGVRVSGVAVDGPAVLERVRRERDRFVGFVLRATDKLAADGLLVSGRARFVDAHALEVDGHTRVEARAFVMATGSSPWVPPPYQGLGDARLDNASLFELPDLPASVLVVGTGVIALELGQALHRLGVRVTLVGVGGFMGPLTDPVVKGHALRIFGDELDIHPDYDLLDLERDAGGHVRARFVGRDGVARDERYERVLVAAGRRPNVVDVALDRAGVSVDERGLVRVDPHTMQLGDSHVFLAGDVTGDRPLLHEAADEGQIAGANAAHFPNVTAGARRTPLAIVFSSPQIAMIGATHAQLDPGRFRSGDVDYGDQGRARVMNQHRGWVRVYGDRETRALLGAEMLGPRVEHTAHLLAWAVQQGLTVDEALDRPFYHPVVEEGIRTALRDLQVKLGRA